MEIRLGDAAWFRSGEKHWHGAAPDAAMSHIAIQERLECKAVEWMEQVTEAEQGAGPTAVRGPRPRALRDIDLVTVLLQSGDKPPVERTGSRTMLFRILRAAAVPAVLLALAGPATAQGSLNLYCSVQVEWCQAAANAFGRETGIRVAVSQKGSGEVLAQIRAEAQNPRGDLWYGGTGDPHLQAAEENLSAEYRPASLDQLHDWSQKQARDSRYRTVGIYAGALGMAFNPELLARRSIAAPACWRDLLDARFRNEIQMANPQSSGTAYVMIATIVQIMGEDPAFEYLKALHRNINAYPRSGTGPIKSVARGETAVSVSFVHDAVTERLGGFPVSSALPCEGTGYEVGSMSIIRGARNLRNAQRFYDWALTPAAQQLGAEAKQFQTPSNRATPVPPEAPQMSQIRLIDYDFAKYGASAERRRLIERWDREVNALPR